jgi:hypothetical protein
MKGNNTPQDKEDIEKPKWYEHHHVLIGMFLIILGICGINLLLLYDDKQHRGTFGDMFGGVNAMFSGFAFAGIIYTIILQRRELELQRNELRDTREEFKIQNETLRLQRFENTLFQMISIHHELIDKFSQGIFSKREYLSHAKMNLDSGLSQKFGAVVNFEYVQNNIKSPEEANDLLIEGCENFYFVVMGQQLSHYFRNIYHIFKFIFINHYQGFITDDQKGFYSSLVRAQLSSDELYLIFYNSLVPGLGYPNFLYLIKELDIMQNFDATLIKDKYPMHWEIYENNLKVIAPDFKLPEQKKKS